MSRHLFILTWLAAAVMAASVKPVNGPDRVLNFLQEWQATDAKRLSDRGHFDPQDMLQQSGDLLHLTEALYTGRIADYQSADATATQVLQAQQTLWTSKASAEQLELALQPRSQQFQLPRVIQQKDMEIPQPAQLIFSPLTGARLSQGSQAPDDSGHAVMPASMYREAAAVRPPNPAPFPMLEFALRMAYSRADKPISGQSADSAHLDRTECTAWSLWFISSLVFFAFSVWIFSRGHEIIMPDDQDETLDQAKGRACWDYACIILCVGLACLVFNLTLVSVASENKDINDTPEKTVDGERVLRFPITNQAQRAFEAGDGVALSVVMACFVLVGWRSYGQVKIRSSLLAQFMLRGASVGLSIAMILEMTGQMLLESAGLGGPDGSDFGTLAMMLIVGFSEELAKLIAAVCGTRLTVEALARAERERNCSSICSWCCQLLVRTPRSLALAGVAAGFGFMTVENAGYVMSAASEPPTAYPDRLGPGQSIRPEEMTGGAINVLTAVTIAVRVMLNIHPWLTGVSALRVGQVAFRNGSDSACLGPIPMLQAIAPSAVIHAFYDFGLVVTPGAFGVLLPPVFWYCSRFLFMSLWPTDEQEALERALVLPIEAVPPRPPHEEKLPQSTK